MLAVMIAAVQRRACGVSWVRRRVECGERRGAANLCLRRAPQRRLGGGYAGSLMQLNSWAQDVNGG